MDESIKEKLLAIYYSDSFLQDNFPEVPNGDLDGLLWCVGANFISNHPHAETKFGILKPYKNWFIENIPDMKQRPIQTSFIDKISLISAIPLPITHEYTSILGDTNEHLVTLSMLNIEFDLKNVVELGVLFGNSTITLTESVSKINGHLWSIDLDDCKLAHELVSKANLNNFWTFLQGDDLEIGKTWNQPIDHLFIDTYHSEKQVFNELELFLPHVKKNGFISIHDTRSFKGVLSGILKYFKNNYISFRFYNYINCNGLSIIRKLD